MPEEKYTHGHHESVLRSHRWRTAANSAGYLVPHLRPGMSVLDVGCGPGTITIELAAIVAPGSTLGVDASSDVVAAARSAAADAGRTVDFRVDDAYALAVPDASFDVVHAHQVLQHLADPVAALREWARVAKPGGLVAARDADYDAFRWYPEVPLLDRWLHLYRTAARSNRGEPDAGRRLLAWARAAELTAVSPTATAWCFATPADRTWWAETWAERISRSALADQLLADGHASADELEAIAAAWRSWAAHPDGWFVVPHGEILVRR